VKLSTRLGLEIFSKIYLQSSIRIYSGGCLSKAQTYFLYYYYYYYYYYSFILLFSVTIFVLFPLLSVRFCAFVLYCVFVLALQLAFVPLSLHINKYLVN